MVRRLVVGGPSLETAKGSELGKTWLRCLSRQYVPGWEVLAVPLPDHEGLTAGDYSPDESHAWTGSAMRRVGDLRCRFVEEALDAEADAVMLVDDDLILGQGVIARMMQEPDPIVYGAFLTTRPRAGGLAWQVWSRHPNVLDASVCHNLLHGQTETVYGGGACTLLRGDALDLYRWHPLAGLPNEYLWQGEDRAACIRATVHGLSQSAVGAVWPLIRHLYDPQLRTDEMAIAAERELWGDVE